MKLFSKVFPFLLISMIIAGACSDNLIIQHKQLTTRITQYDKAEFRILITEKFNNPYNAEEIALDMILKAPSGDTLSLPCFYESGDGDQSEWKSRFAPRQHGQYAYHFQLSKGGETIGTSAEETFTATPSKEDGFLHIHNYWTLQFDSGKPFRGIGENVGWESRSFADPKWNYDYLLPTLSKNGANFFRSWMSPNNFPLEWKTVKDTKRYTDSDEYFNPGGVQRLDEIVELADSLGLYMMLALDSHNALMENNQWEIHNYNIKNGGPARTPAEFFTLEASRRKYRNRLRYLVARWGYSTSIAAWEFFNEIDNAVHTRQDSIIIPHEAVTDWHKEMAAYLKRIDPYDHIVTTSVSHREIEGMFALQELDLNQMHIYKRTGRIPAGILQYTEEYSKPFSWGEFSYEWDWNKDFDTFADEMDYDYKRGLWYGLFSPTPILPMTWWWEFFDKRGMTPYFKNVREINDRMLAAGKGSFELVNTSAEGLETYGVKCGETYFVYVLNNSSATRVSEVTINGNFSTTNTFKVEIFNPGDSQYQEMTGLKKGDQVEIPAMRLKMREERVLIFTTSSKLHSTSIEVKSP